MRKAGFLLIFAVFFLNINTCRALPEFSVLSALKCSECHTNNQGSGMRSDFGWTFGRDVAMFTPQQAGLEGLYDLLGNSYGYFDGALAVGGDFRMQTARAHNSPDSERKYFPMQASAYMLVQPTDWISAQGQYNFGPKIFNGQRLWQASLLISPGENLPSLRIGHFQPSLGVRICDMTSLDRRIAAFNGTETLIAPDFAEYGAELIYEAQDWLTVNAGIYDSRSLGELSLYGQQRDLLRVPGNPSFMAKFMLWLDYLHSALPDGYFGASAFVNGDFWVSNIFTRFAITPSIFLNAQFAMSDNEYIRETRNWIGGVTFVLYKGVLLGLRAETGRTNLTLVEDAPYEFDVNQVVLDAKIFPLPYVEIIPEYRFLDTEEYKSTRWAVQVHLYY